jgi:LemA protein
VTFLNFKFLPLFIASFGLTQCGWQSIPKAKNAVDADVAEVSNQYKRRADLIPNLVSVVKGYASHEQETLTAVTEARASATQSTIDPTKMSPEDLAKFQQAQGSLSQALGRLMVVAEKYPDLKADQNFRDLQVQLEGTENRITVARNRLIQTIKAFNDLVTVPPTSWTNSIIYHHEKMPQWSVSEAEQKQNETAPKVEF